MAVQLSAGSIAAINNGEKPEDVILQVIAVRKFPTGDRCRLLVSDGVHRCGFAIMATQLNPMINSGEVAQHAVIKVTKYFCNQVSEKKKMMIILGLEVLLTAEDVGGEIGNPTTYESGTSNAPAGAPAAASNHSITRPSPVANVQRSAPGNAPAADGGGMMPQAPDGFPNVRPIQTLTPYQNKWSICARVTQKSNIRTWSNSRGEGKLFSMELLDQSGEIRATAFNAECDKFYDMIEPNKVYYICSATLKTANKQFTSVKNDYEMTFNSGTQVVRCTEEKSIPAMQFDFVTIDQLENAQKDTIVDLIGLCRDASEVATIVQRSTGKELRKREISIVDHTNRAVSLTLWAEQAEKFDGTGNPVIAVKGAKVSDFGGVSLSLLGSSTLQVNPDISEAHQLKGWWEQAGCNSSDIINLSNQRGGAGNAVGANAVFKTLLEAKKEGLGSRDQPDYYNAKAIVTLVRKENILYQACPNDGCNKKVMDLNNGMYRCEKCCKELDRFNWRLMLSCNVADFTENHWVTVFQDQAELMLGSTAQELGTLRDENPDMFQSIIAGASFKEYNFRLRVKMETYNDESRLKTMVMSAAPVNPVDLNRRLIKEIRELSA
ncbi:replication protein A 70 kDa DNA-binding subunit isoform X2 [Hyalella azteca]|uniref:Replication protein A subunit n=1 Tax=Hyalella azteca TaxID=294128 RepID=A0A8B7P712_HYAAZ|nr:replication protein A 70 kDa DNA-binding subunit isoform X2 [Hyalella azteca]